MLKQFRLKNYKNFKDEIILDLSNIAGYQYNLDCVYDNLISKALIYGRNATGKTNLGRAIMDIAYIIRGLSGFEDDKTFLNADSREEYASFKYYFVFEGHNVNYEYSRKSSIELIKEKLKIDEKLVFNCDYLNKINDFSGMKYVNAETVNIERYLNSANDDEETGEVLGKRIPFLRWLTSNTMLSNDSILMQLLNYIFRMSYIGNDVYSPFGIKRRMTSFFEILKEGDRVKDFERFLNAMGIECSLVLKELPDNQFELYFLHDKLVPFIQTASSGTLAATTLYRRLAFSGLYNTPKPSLIFIDEFDAFYHYEMSKNVIEYLKKNYTQTQVIFTTHNTVLMSNRIMRPDCLFILSTKGNLTPLHNATERELREGHNLAKMYMSGEFEKYE